MLLRLKRRYIHPHPNPPSFRGREIQQLCLGVILLAFGLGPTPALAEGWFSWGSKKSSVVLGTPDFGADQSYDTHVPMAAPSKGAWGSPSDPQFLTPKDRAFFVRRLNDHTALIKSAITAQQAVAQETARAMAANARVPATAALAPSKSAVRSGSTPAPVRPAAAPAQTTTPAYRAPPIPVQDWDNITKGMQNPPVAAPVPDQPIKPIIIPNPNLRKKQAAQPPATSGK